MTRHRVLAVVSVAVLGLVATTEASSPPDELIRVELSDEVMGTMFSIVLYGNDRAVLEGAGRSALDEAHRLDRLLSNYNPTSEWTAVNRAAATRPVTISPELFHLLSACVEYSRQSDGAFDITVGPLMKVWGFYKGEGVLPPKADVATALSRVGYRHVALDPHRLTVRFDRPGVELDPGGIGKGYAVDRMVDVLKGHGVNTALISAGGSSIYGLGAPPGEANGWRIVIRASGDLHNVAAEVWLKETSLSTSGSHEKFFWADGQTYSHIMDPRTGYPSKGAASVSVLAPKAIDSEAWTKPAFINGRDWTAQRVPRHVRVFFCDDNRDRTCRWIQQP